MLNIFKRRPKYDWQAWFGDLHPFTVDRHTPDLAELEMKAQHLLFTYHDSKVEERLLCKGLTNDTSFVMYKKDLRKESFPLAFQTTYDQKLGRSTMLGDPARVAGNLYLVPSKVIRDLDNRVLNGVWFDRKEVKVDVPHRKLNGSKTPGPMEITTVKAWMYVARMDYWSEQLDGKSILFKKVGLRPANNEMIGKYYFYNEHIEGNSS